VAGDGGLVDDFPNLAPKKISRMVRMLRIAK
jgi:hypothetical protein